MKFLLKVVFFPLLIITFTNTYAEDRGQEIAPKTKSLTLNTEVIQGLEELINRLYVDEVDKQELYENTIKGMFNGLDPHSDFLNPEEQEDFIEDASGTFGGIGIVINKKDDFIEIISPIDDTPGDRAGLKSGDTIVKINET